jgi:hypothetical protein
MNSLHSKFKEGIGHWASLKNWRDFLFKVSRLEYNCVPEEVLYNFTWPPQSSPTLVTTFFPSSPGRYCRTQLSEPLESTVKSRKNYCPGRGNE